MIMRTVEEAVLDSSGFFYGRKILVCYGDVLYVHFDGEGCKVFLSSLLRELVFVEYRTVFWALKCQQESLGALPSNWIGALYYSGLDGGSICLFKRCSVLQFLPCNSF